MVFALRVSGFEVITDLGAVGCSSSLAEMYNISAIHSSEDNPSQDGTKFPVKHWGLSVGSPRDHAQGMYRPQIISQSPYTLNPKAL